MRPPARVKPESALTTALFAAHLAVESIAATESATGKTPEDLWMFAPLAQVKRAAKAAMQPQGLMLLLASSKVSTAPADRDRRSLCPRGWSGVASPAARPGARSP